MPTYEELKRMRQQRAVSNAAPSVELPEEESFWQKINTPLVNIINPETRSAINRIRKTANPLSQAVLRAGEFLGDTASSMSSPLSVVLGGTSTAGALFPRLTGLANTAQKVAGGATALHGGYNVINAESLPEAAGGLLEAGLGGLSYKAATRGTPKAKAPVPEVKLPEPITDPRRLLSANSEVKSPRFLAGKEGIADVAADYRGPTATGELSVKLPPDVVANYGDLPTVGKPSAMPSVKLDLDAVAEAKRLANIRGSQGWNGMTKVGKEPTVPDIPVPSGDIRRGFAPQSNADLPYPLNVVPNAARPRTVQSVTEALTPERMKVDLPESSPVTPLTQANEIPEVKLPGQKSEMLPSAKPKWRKTGNVVVDKAAESPVPEIRQAAAQMSSEPKKISLWSKATSTAGTQLKEMGEAGTELYRRASRVTQLERQNLAAWAEPYKNAIKKLSKDEFDNFADFVEGRRPITSPAVKEAVDAWTDVASKSGAEGVGSGLRMKLSTGETVPFNPITEKYYPRHITEAAMKNKESLVETLVKEEKLTRLEAERIIKNAREHGELMLGPQHQRLNRRFEYRKDAGSGLIHLESMAKRTAMSRELGPLDLAGKGKEGIHDLIEATSDPGRATEIMKRVVGRDEKVVKELDQFVRQARSAASWMRLQNYAISAITGNQLPNAMRASTKEYLRSVGQVFTDFKKLKSFADESGALVNVSHGVLEEMSKLNPMKVYGGTFVENVVRAQAAGIGRGMAKTLFQELKANPGNAKAAKELFELVLEKPANLLKQEALTPKQLLMAAGRNAELSQGLTNAVNLPLWATQPVNSVGNAGAQLGLMFKKQAMLQNKMLQDAMKANPVKTAAILVGGGQIAGGVIGTTKSTAKGLSRSLVSGNPTEKIKDELEHRSDYVGQLLPGKLGESKVLRNAVDRQLQSWTLGIWGDVLSTALGGNSSLAEFIAGPVVGIGDDILQGVKNPVQGGRNALRALPLPGGIGSGLQVELLPTRNQKNRGKPKGKSGSLPKIPTVRLPGE